MNNVNEKINEGINDLYRNRGYLARYGFDLIITLICCFIIWMIYLYYTMVSEFDTIDSNWDTEKCKPTNILFAGMIRNENKIPKGMSRTTFAAYNFKECMSSIIDTLGRLMIKPFELASMIPAGALASIEQLMQPLYVFFNWFRDNINKVFNYINNLINSLLTPISNLLIGVNNIFQKITAFMMSTMYSIYAFLLTIISFLKTMFTAGWTVVGLLVGVLFIFFMVIPFIGWPIAGALAVVASGAITMLTTFNIGMTQMIKYLPGGNKSCFHPNTKLILNNNKIIRMKDIKIGDVLENGSKVIGILNIDNKDEKLPFYKIKTNHHKLNKYIYVTGNHLIQDPITQRFIPIAEHNNSIKTNIVNEEFSCLITNDHLIKIGDNIFWDWED